MDDNRLLAYGNKMINDSFDGSVGFAMDGGIKDASLVPHVHNGSF
jgi:hypothetical protein